MDQTEQDLLENFSVFRVCDLTLHNRQMIGCAPTIESVLEYGAVAMRKNVDRILLASDGCEITSDLVLNALQSQMLILLSPGETWVPYTPINVPYDPNSKSVPYDPSINPPHLCPELYVASTSTNEKSSEQSEQVSNETSTKAEIVIHIEDYLADSHEANSSMNEENITEPIVLGNPLTEQENLSVSEENLSPNLQAKRSAEPIIVEKPKRRATTDMKFQSFQINWSKLSDRLSQLLDRFQSFWSMNPKQPVPRELRVTRDDVNELVAVVVDQLRTIDKTISATTMEAVAKQITARYPCLDFRLTTDDDGFKDGNGYVGIKTKLIHRNSYKNRFKDQNEVTQSRSVKTKLRNVQSGTLKEYWQNTSKQCSTNVISILKRDEPEMLTNEFLTESQGHVRYLFDTENLEELLSQMPVLRRTTLLNYHFEKATGVNVSDLSKYFLAKKHKIIDFSRTSKKRTLGEEATNREIFDFLTQLVDEQLDDLIIQKEMGTNVSTITTNVAGPVLVCIDMGDHNNIFYVYAEKTRLTEGTRCILDAFQNLMAVYYVHNFMYVERCSKILEFIQQYFLKILPETGSKSQATRVNGRQRLVKRIILTLSAHEVNAA